MEISSNTNSILSSDLYSSNSTEIKEEKDRFDIFLENEEKKKIQEQETAELLENIDFVAKTGFTKDELELIKQKLEEIQKARVESGQTTENIEDYINTLKQDLQQAIYEVTGKKVDLEENALNNFMNELNSQEQFVAPTTDESLRLLADFKTK